MNERAQEEAAAVRPEFDCRVFPFPAMEKRRERNMIRDEVTESSSLFYDPIKKGAIMDNFFGKQASGSWIRLGEL